MAEFQEAAASAGTPGASVAGRVSGHGRDRENSRVAGVAGGFLALLFLAGCTMADDLAVPPQESAAQQPQGETTEGTQDEVPKLSAVPDAPLAPATPEVREQAMATLTIDGNKALFTEADPLVMTASADLDPFAASTIISSDSVSRSSQVAALETAAGPEPGQLAAIIFFGHGSVVLDENDLAVLSDLVTLHSQQGGRLHVVGHASSRTRNTTPDQHQVANFEMSLKRANTVSAELLRLGVAPEALSTEAKADAEPVYHEFMPSGEAGNRRVEIFLAN